MSTYTTTYPSMNDYETSLVVDRATSSLGFGMAIFFLIYVLIVVLMIVSMWKIFVRAGKPGWACLVPVYNIIVMLEIANMPTWYVLLAFIPFVNFIIMIMILINFGKAFGKSTGFVLGMMFLPLIFYPILAFGKSEYVG